MTEQEAVERLKCMRLFMQIEDDKNECKFLEDDYIANDMAIKALEKQIPKKPFRDKYNYNFWACPVCARELYWDNEYGQQKFNHCSNCGQKLNWEEV